MIVVLEIKTS